MPVMGPGTGSTNNNWGLLAPKPDRFEGDQVVDPEKKKEGLDRSQKQPEQPE